MMAVIKQIRNLKVSVRAECQALKKRLMANIPSR